MCYKLLNVLCIASAVFSVIVALKSSVYAAMVLIAISGVSFYMLRRANRASGERGDGDVAAFVSNLIDNYNKSASTLKLLGASLDSRFWFYKDIKASISAYSAGRDAESAFSKELNSDSASLRELASVLVQRLDQGTGALEALKDIRRRVRSVNRYRLKSFGSLFNADSVVRLGSILFFPMFAGISLQITQFSTSGVGAAAAKPWSLILIFAFYIVQSNVANFQYTSDPLKVEKSSLSSALAMLVFKVSSVMSTGML